MLIKKHLRFAAATITPKWATAPLYRLALVIMQRKAKKIGLTLWARHSYRLGHWSPFLSDIDLSIITTRTSADPALNEYLRYHKLVRKFIPILGEVNFYFEDGLFASYICPFELKKDPELENRLPLQPKTNAAWRALFILKTLEYNSEDFFAFEKPILPELKWRYFCELVGLEFSDTSSLVDNCLKVVIAYFSNTPGFNESHLRELLFSIGTRCSFDTIETNPTVSTLYLNRFVHRHPEQLLMGQAVTDFLSALVSWEVWGISTQLPIAQFDPKLQVGFVAHIQNLSVFLSGHPKIPNQNELTLGLEKLMTRLQHAPQHHGTHPQNTRVNPTTLS